MCTQSLHVRLPHSPSLLCDRICTLLRLHSSCSIEDSLSQSIRACLLINFAIESRNVGNKRDASPVEFVPRFLQAPFSKQRSVSQRTHTRAELRNIVLDCF